MKTGHLPKKRCLVSAPAHSDLRTLFEALREHGYQPVVPDSFEASTPFRYVLAQALASVDLAIAAVPETGGENIFFELGMAAGLGKRLLVIVHPNRQELPTDIRSFLLIRAHLDNKEAISFSLDQLSRAPAAKCPHRSPRVSSGRVLGNRAHEWQERLLRLPKERPTSPIEKFVESLLREASSSEVFTASRSKDEGWDFALWTDSLESLLGNPLAVEVKTALGGRADLKHVSEQLQGYLRKAGPKYALLLYLEGPATNAPEWDDVPPNILPLRIADLIAGLESQSFERIVGDIRNRRVHREGR